MKLLFENWRKYLIEDKKPLGDIAFANDAMDFLNLPEEPDTEIEKQLAKMLEQHFLDNKPLPAGYAMTIVNIINQGLYPETFQRYDKGEVYRGMALPKEVFEEKFGPLPEKPKWYRAPLEALMMRATRSFDSDGPTYEPHQRRTKKPKGKTQAALFPDLGKIAVSSWTSKQGQTDHFRQLDNPEEEVSIVLVADASNQKNYFIDSKPLYNYDFAYSMRMEAEVIGIGDIIIKDIIWHYEGI